MAKGKYLSNGQYYGFNVTSVNGQIGDVNVPTVAVSDTQPASNADIWIDTSEPSGESGTVVTKIGNAYGEVTLDANSMSMNNNVLGSKLNMELLWTNPNPTSAFAGQTLSVQVSNGYRFILIYFKNYTNYGDGFVYINYKAIPSAQVAQGMASAKIVYRSVTVRNDNTIIFGDGYTSNTYGTATINNETVIPYYIYGIK